jgi:hypothetical protein
MESAMRKLEVFVGEWSMQPVFGNAELNGVSGRAVFEWTLGGHYLTQRTEVDHPEAPDSFAVIGIDAAGEGYTQHYFDARGVTRLYAMSLTDRVWTLLRVTADFSPLDFSQRYVGTFAADGNSIDGRWETSVDGSSWERDFDLSYTRTS